MVHVRVLGIVALLLGLCNSTLADERDGITTERRTQMEELLKKRIVLLSGKIDDDSATIAIAQLLFLESEGSQEVSLVIDSVGGSVTAGFALRDTIRGLKAPVRTYCSSHCSGMAAIALAAGGKGRRHVAPDARIELHDITGPASAPAEGRARARRALVTALTTSTGQTAAQVDHDLRAGLVLTSKEAVTYGLADTVESPPVKS